MVINGGELVVKQAVSNAVGYARDVEGAAFFVGDRYLAIAAVVIGVILNFSGEVGEVLF